MAMNCESCLVAGLITLATTTSVNPDYAGYALCEECAAEYDARQPVARVRDDNAASTN